MDHDRAVVDPVAVHAAGRRRRAPGSRSALASTIVVDRRVHALEQGVLQEQVVDRVAGQAQLGEDRDRDALVVAGRAPRRAPPRRWPPGRRPRPAPCRRRPGRTRARRPSRSPRAQCCRASVAPNVALCRPDAFSRADPCVPAVSAVRRPPARPSSSTSCGSHAGARWTPGPARERRADLGREAAYRNATASSVPPRRPAGDRVAACSRGGSGSACSVKISTTRSKARSDSSGSASRSATR